MTKKEKKELERTHTNIFDRVKPLDKFKEQEGEEEDVLELQDEDWLEVEMIDRMDRLSRKAEENTKWRADQDKDVRAEKTKGVDIAGSSDQAEQSAHKMDNKIAGQTELKTVLYTSQADTVHLYGQGSVQTSWGWAGAVYHILPCCLSVYYILHCLPVCLLHSALPACLFITFCLACLSVC